MMTHAYQEIYLANAQAALGEAFDYAVNVCNISGNDFVKMFVVSSISKQMENGEPNVLSGKSGIEIVMEILRETKGLDFIAEPVTRFGRSAEYWIGWAVAYYQWWSGHKYSSIFTALPYDDLRRMYRTLHEADITKFAEIADARMKEYYPETNLKRFRMIHECSQSELANMSGVGLRSIQMYEQRKKDINKASAETLYRIAKSLGCNMEDLLER